MPVGQRISRGKRGNRSGAEHSFRDYDARSVIHSHPRQPHERTQLVVTGFAFYGISASEPDRSLATATAIFARLNLHAVEVSEYVRTTPDAAGKSLHLVETDWQNYLRDPKSANIRFRAISASGTTELTGGFDDGANVGFSLVDLAVRHQQPLPESEIIDVIDHLSGQLSPSYGFAFTCTRPEQVVSYANGNAAVLFTGSEDPFSFIDDLSEWSGGEDSYKRTRLRMVYPYNLLNRDHLAISVAGQSLGDWIRAQDDRGRIIELNSQFAVWIVPAETLQDINQLLGATGLLISWRPERAAGPRRKLP